MIYDICVLKTKLNHNYTIRMIYNKWQHHILYNCHLFVTVGNRVNGVYLFGTGVSSCKWSVSV